MTASATLPQVAAPFEWRTAGEVVWLAADLGAVAAAFTTRLGGVSDGPYRSLNLGVLTDDDTDHVHTNRRRALEALDRPPGSIAMGRQVHGAAVELRDEAGEEGAPLREADAQVTSSAGVTPLVLVADCVPLVLAGPRAVAAVHCGWRGVAAGIVPRAVAETRARGGEVVRAALGPGIGACCYEVGDEVRAAFRARGHGAGVAPGGRLDLALAVRRELEAAGVGSVHACGLCTSCNGDLFFSHRRDRGVTGRQAALAWLGS